MKTYLLLILGFLISSGCYAQENNIEINELKVYAYPFGRKIRLAINPNTIVERSLVELKLKSVQDPPYNSLVKGLTDFLESKKESKDEYLGDVRMLLIVKFENNVEKKLFISTSNRLMIDEVIYDINDEYLKLLVSPLTEYFKPKRLRN